MLILTGDLTSTGRLKVFADVIKVVTRSVSSGAGCCNIDYSDASPKELSEAIAMEFDGLRRENTLAVVDLTYGGIGGTRMRGRAHSPVMFKVQALIFTLLNKLTVGVVPMPAMFRIMKGDGARYSTLKWSNDMERRVTYAVVIGISAFGLSKFML